MARRLSALLLALLVAAAGVSPCTAAAVARARDAAPARDPHAAHAGSRHAGDAAHAGSRHAGDTAHAQTAASAQRSGHCHGPKQSVGPECPCGCTGDAARGATSPFSGAWGLPAPALAGLEPGRPAVPPGPSERPIPPGPSRIEHVPIAA
jgi:hypothetical protein